MSWFACQFAARNSTPRRNVGFAVLTAWPENRFRTLCRWAQLSRSIECGARDADFRRDGSGGGAARSTVLDAVGQYMCSTHCAVSRATFRLLTRLRANRAYSQSSRRRGARLPWGTSIESAQPSRPRSQMTFVSICIRRAAALHPY